MLKRNLAMLTALSLLAAIAAGCGSSSGKASDDKGKNDSKAAQEAYKMPGEPIELIVTSTSGDSEDSFNERFGNLIKKKYPNITLKYLQTSKTFGIKEMVAGGQQFDLYFDSIGFFAGGLLDNNLQMDMTELLKKHNIDLSRFESTTVDGIKMLSGGNAIFGVPVYNSNLVMYYNKDIFDKFGVAYPKDNMTWDDLTSLAKKMTRFDGDKLYSGFSTSGTHVLRMNQMSLPYVDKVSGKSAISTDGWKKYYDTIFIKAQIAGGHLEYMQKYNKTPYTTEFFQTKDTAMFVLLSSSMFVTKEFDSMNWDLAALPTFKELPGIGSQPYPSFFSVTSTSKHKDEAAEIIKYLVSDEAQLQMSKTGVIPVLTKDEVKKAFGTESRFKDKNLKAVFLNKFAPIPYKSRYDTSLESPYVKAVGNAMTSGDLNTALRQAEEQANATLDKAKQ